MKTFGWGKQTNIDDRHKHTHTPTSTHLHQHTESNEFGA